MRPLILIHGYSASGLDFAPLCEALSSRGIDATLLNVCTYVSLNNEVTIKDIAEGLDRAFRSHPVLKDETQPFDAIVHSTGMLVIRSWLTNYGAAVDSNPRLKRLKHLIGLAPATWGSPQAHKGRTWLGALLKGNRQPGPDFLNAGDQVLSALELGSQFTWDLAHLDLLVVTQPYYDDSNNTPYVCVFIGNQPYDGLDSVANDPGTDGTVRWSGCALNTRKVTLDLTRTPTGDDGKQRPRVSISQWADNRLDVPLLAVEGRNHATLVSNPEPGMVDRVVSFLHIEAADGHRTWLEEARQHSEPAQQKMLLNPGACATGLGEDVERYFAHLFHPEPVMEGWQQFVVRAVDERGDGISDYVIEILTLAEDGSWRTFQQMYAAVHAFRDDTSYRCFHIHLPPGISTDSPRIRARIHASTGTDLVTYQGYGDVGGTEPKPLASDASPIEIEITEILFHPFTTTLIEIVLNREPLPLNQIGKILYWLTEK